MILRCDPSRNLLELLIILMVCVPLPAAEKAPERFDVRAFGAVGGAA